MFWVSAALSVGEQLKVLLSVSADAVQYLLVHALRASIRNNKPKTRMHF